MCDSTEKNAITAFSAPQIVAFMLRQAAIDTIGSAETAENGRERLLTEIGERKRSRNFYF